MTSNEAVESIRGLSVDEIVHRHSKKDLISLYKAMFGIEPRGVYKKEDLAYKCWSFIVDAERTRDLCKLLS